MILLASLRSTASHAVRDRDLRHVLRFAAFGADGSRRVCTDALEIMFSRAHAMENKFTGICAPVVGFARRLFAKRSGELSRGLALFCSKVCDAARAIHRPRSRFNPGR